MAVEDLALAIPTDDTTIVMDETLEFLEDLPRWHDVLTTYAALAEEQTQTPAENSESEETYGQESWVLRLAELDEIDSDELNRTHGRLIALDLLEFTIVNRTDGLGYQITKDGMKLLKKVDSVTDRSMDDECDDEPPYEDHDEMEYLESA